MRPSAIADMSDKKRKSGGKTSDQWDPDAPEDKVFTRGTCRYLATKLEPLKPQLRRFNNKDREIVDPPDLNNLATFMKAMEADDSFECLVKEYFAASGSMFLLMTHIMVLQILLWHPVDFARKARETHVVQKLKTHPTRANLRDYLVSEILSHSTAPSHKRRGTDVPSVWDEGYEEHDDETDDDSSDDDDEPNIWDTAAAGPSGETHTSSPPVTPQKTTTS